MLKNTNYTCTRALQVYIQMKLHGTITQVLQEANVDEISAIPRGQGPGGAQSPDECRAIHSQLIIVHTVFSVYSVRDSETLIFQTSDNLDNARRFHLKPTLSERHTHYS